MNHFNFSRKIFIRSIATFLAALLCYESGATPLAQAAMLSQPAAIRASSPGSSHSAQQISRNANSASFSEPFRVPSSVGSTVEVFAPAKAGRLVYHLQDVHNNVPAQTNLSEIVSLLEAYAAKQNKNLVVAVEGVSGPVDSDIISRFPDQKAKEDVGAGLLRAGYMLGEEYAAITHAPGRIKIVGIETPSLYGANVAARRLSRAARKSVLSTLHETHAQLSKLIPHNFNSVLSQLEQKRVAVEDGRLPLADYATFLKNTNAKVVVRYPNLAKMVALSSQETGIDFDKVEKEGKSLVQELMVNKSEKQVNEMLEDARALKEGRLSPLSYYSILLGQSKRDYPLVRQYVAYLRASDGIDAERLFDEVLEAESEIAKGLIRHPLALQLYEHIRWIEQQERFFSLNMIPQEWAEQKKRDVRSIIVRHAAIRAFIAEQVGDLGYSFSAPSLGRQTLFSAYSGARGFYLAAEARDTAMINNLKTVIASTDKEKSLVAFIAGGFHTSGMTRQLRANGFAYEVIRPQLETEVELSGQVNFRSKKIDYLRDRGALAVPGVAADVAKTIEGTLPAEDLQQKLTVKQDDGTPPSSTGGTPNPTLLERAKKIVDDAAKPEQPKDIGWAIVAVAALTLLLAAAVFHFVANVLFEKKAEPVTNKEARNETPKDETDLTVGQQKSVSTRAADLKITTLSDIAYMMQMLRQYLFSGSKDNKLKLITNRIAQNGGNFLPDSLMTPEERTSLIGIINYKDIAVAGAKPSTVVDLIVNPLDGGLGESFGRKDYLQKFMPEGVKLGAKATDLRISVDVSGVVHELTIAEVKLLQLIRDRQNNIATVGNDLYEPAVSDGPDGSLESYQKLLTQPFFFDRIDPSKQKSPRTYLQVLKENGVGFDDFYVQKKVPGISVETGDFGSNGAGLLQVAGHGQIGFHFFFEALRKAKGGLFGAGRSVVRVFLNGDNPNSRVNRKIVDNMVANNHVIYMLVTPAEPLDKKGGKLGVRFVDVDGKKVAVPDMMELAQAKDAGQEKDFYKLGQENGIGDAGKQSFNTNVLYINESLLGDILKDLEKVLGSSYALSKAFSATRIPKDKKTVNGKGYLPLDGAIGSVLLNLNAFFLTTQDERVKDILRSRGVDRLLHLVNVPRVEFFTPNKVPTDHYLFNFSDRFQFDLNALTFKDTNPGFQQPEIVLTSKDPNDLDDKGNPKDTGFWTDLQSLINNLGKRLGARELKSLDINGKVSLANAQLRGDVKIVSEVPVTKDGSDVVDLNTIESPDLPRNGKGQLLLENVNIVIRADRSVVVTKNADAAKSQSFSSKFPLFLAALSLGALYFTVDTSVGLSWPMLNNFGSTALLVIAAAFTTLTGLLDRKVRNAPVVPENTTIESLLTNDKVDPELVQAVIDFAKANGNLAVKVERGILADVNNKTKTLRVGTAILTNKALLLTVLAHEQAHLSALQLPLKYLVFRLINEVPGYFLGLFWYLPKFAFRGLPVAEKAATERSYEETGITNGVADAGKPENQFASGLRKIDLPQQKATGVTNLYIDLGNLQFSGDMADVVKSVIKMAGRVTEVSGRTVQLVVVNSGDPALESAFKALMNLNLKMGIQVRTLGSAELPADRTTADGELNLAKIFEAAGFTNNVQMPVPEKNKPGNIVVFGTAEVKLPAGVKFVPVFDNFLHLALLLYTYTRYSDPDGVLKLLAGLIFSILGIQVLQNIIDQNKLKELTDMMA